MRPATSLCRGQAGGEGFTPSCKGLKEGWDVKVHRGRSFGIGKALDCDQQERGLFQGRETVKGLKRRLGAHHGRLKSPFGRSGANTRCSGRIVSIGFQKGAHQGAICGGAGVIRVRRSP